MNGQSRVKGKGSEEQAKAGRYVVDLLLFTSLAPVQEKRKRGLFKSRYSRLAIEVMSPKKLHDTLAQIASQVAADGEIDEIPALEGAGLSENDTVAQRLLKLSLTNVKESVRRELGNNDLFKSILEGDNILEVMLASGGAIEQRFLNTCAAAAVTQQIQSQVSSIIGLLQVGRTLANRMETQVNVEPNERNKLGERVKKRGFGKKHTVQSLVRKRVTDARVVFDQIQHEATEILAKRPVRVEKLQKLTQRWGRVMQKLAATLEYEKGEAGIPVLTKNRIREHWKTSAAVAILLGAPLDRAKKRKQGTDDAYFLREIKESVDLEHGSKKANVQLNSWLEKDGKERQLRIARTQQLWDNVYATGGALYAVPGHALYMKAIKRGGTKAFSIGDPVVDKYVYKTTKQMERYVAKHSKLLIQSHVTSDTSLGGYFIRDQVPAYRDAKAFVEGDEPSDTVDRTARVVTATPEQYKGADVVEVKFYIKDDIFTSTRHVDPADIVIL